MIFSYGKSLSKQQSSLVSSSDFKKISFIFFTFLGILNDMVKAMGPKKPANNIVICTETFFKTWDNMEPQRGFIEIVVFCLMLAMYLLMLPPLYLKRRSNESQDNHTLRKIPRSLESLLLNFGFLVISLSCSLLFAIMNG